MREGGGENREPNSPSFRFSFSLFCTQLTQYRIQKLIEVNKVLAGKNHEMRDLIDEKDGAIQVLQDELSTTQLEVTKLDEAVRELKLGNEALAARSRQLETENAELLEWRKRATEEADRMKALMEATEECVFILFFDLASQCMKEVERLAETGIYVYIFFFLGVLGIIGTPIRCYHLP